MRKILKHLIRLTEEQLLELPSGSTLLHVAYKGDQLYLWVEVPESSDSTDTYIIKVVGTGALTNLYEYRYLGTVHQKSFVWHIYYYIA